MYVAYMFGQFLAIILVISLIFLVVKLIVRLQLKIAIKKTFVRKNKKRPRSGLPIQEINNSVNPPVK